MEVARKKAKRIGIAIVGGTVLLFGIVAIPYPGPGWLIVFTGLAILATEFPWARKVLDFAKSKYDAWTMWLKSQKPVVRITALVATGLVVVLTLWLLNVPGLIMDLFDIQIDWLRSPLFY